MNFYIFSIPVSLELFGAKIFAATHSLGSACVVNVPFSNLGQCFCYFLGLLNISCQMAGLSVIDKQSRIVEILGFDIRMINKQQIPEISI